MNLWLNDLRHTLACGEHIFHLVGSSMIAVPTYGTEDGEHGKQILPCQRHSPGR